MKPSAEDIKKRIFEIQMKKPDISKLKKIFELQRELIGEEWMRNSMECCRLAKKMSNHLTSLPKEELIEKIRQQTKRADEMRRKQSSI